MSPCIYLLHGRFEAQIIMPRVDLSADTLQTIASFPVLLLRRQGRADLQDCRSRPVLCEGHRPRQNTPSSVLIDWKVDAWDCYPSRQAFLSSLTFIPCANRCFMNTKLPATSWDTNAFTLSVFQKWQAQQTPESYQAPLGSCAIFTKSPVSNMVCSQSSK